VVCEHKKKIQREKKDVRTREERTNKESGKNVVVVVVVVVVVEREREREKERRRRRRRRRKRRRKRKRQLCAREG
jgi:hypothetical protein